MCILIERREEFNCFVEFSSVTRNLSLFLYPCVAFGQLRDFDISILPRWKLIGVNLVGNWEI